MKYIVFILWLFLSVIIVGVLREIYPDINPDIEFTIAYIYGAINGVYILYILK